MVLGGKMDKVTKWKRITIYLFAFLYLTDFIMGTINTSYSTDKSKSTSIVFVGFFGYSLFKQFYLYKERSDEFSKMIVVISVIVLALSLFNISSNFTAFLSRI